MSNVSKRNFFESFIGKYVLSSCSSVIAETATFPFDIVKTRLQIQGSQNAAVKRGMIQIFIGIVREEGLPKLWQGVPPAVLRQVVYNGARLALYQSLREHVFSRNEDGSFAIWKSISSGIIAGSLGQFIASPTDLIKVQMQMEGMKVLQGQPRRIHGTVHAFKINLIELGFFGMWRGWLPNCQRAALVAVADLTTYDTTKQFIMKNTNLGDTFYTYTLASIASGLACAVIGTPADVLKSRIMNNPNQYRGATDCIKQTVQREGLFSLYKGFIPIWARNAPWALVFWLTYEQLSVAVGANTF